MNSKKWILYPEMDIFCLSAVFYSNRSFDLYFTF